MLWQLEPQTGLSFSVLQFVFKTWILYTYSLSNKKIYFICVKLRPFKHKCICGGLSKLQGNFFDSHVFTKNRDFMQWLYIRLGTKLTFIKNSHSHEQLGMRTSLASQCCGKLANGGKLRGTGPGSKRHSVAWMLSLDTVMPLLYSRPECQISRQYQKATKQCETELDG